MNEERLPESLDTQGSATEPKLRAMILELLGELENKEKDIPEKVEQVLKEMEAFGEENPRMWNISRQGGEILYSLAKKFKPRNILEIGTSNGYSTVWLAQAASETGGHIRSYEKREQKIEMAKGNLKKAGLDEAVELVPSEASGESVDSEVPIDFLFMDILPEEYLPIIKKLLPKMSSQAVIVADNLHGNRYQPQEGTDQVVHGDASEYLDFVNNDKRMASTILDVGSGLQIVLFERDEAEKDR